jgi:hypothetical protein
MKRNELKLNHGSRALEKENSPAVYDSAVRSNKGFRSYRLNTLLGQRKDIPAAGYPKSLGAEASASSPLETMQLVM